MSKWAEDWVRLYTRGSGVLAISDCEDQGVLLAIEELDRLKRLDRQRLLILRSASNFTLRLMELPPKKLSLILASSPGHLPELDANYQIGGVVVAALLSNWDRYRDNLPKEFDHANQKQKSGEKRLTPRFSPALMSTTT